jgi:hypothetical protein
MIYFYALRMQFPIAQIRKHPPLAFIVVWVAVLVGTPTIVASASQASIPIGTVLEGESAHVKPESGFAGTTIYDGDRLETKGEGHLRVLLHESQMYLLPGTLTDVHGFPNGFERPWHGAA